MKTFHLNGDNVRLYFTNYERKPDDEEFEEIMSIFKKNGCKFEKHYMAPDCDLIEGKCKDIKFTVVRTIDGDGTFLYCDSPQGMSSLEKMFDM